MRQSATVVQSLFWLRTTAAQWIVPSVLQVIVTSLTCRRHRSHSPDGVGVMVAVEGTEVGVLVLVAAGVLVFVGTVVLVRVLVGAVVPVLVGTGVFVRVLVATAVLVFVALGTAVLVFV